jgi:hypothetical protein
MSTELPQHVTVEPDRVILRGGVGSHAVYGWTEDDDPGYKSFVEQFEIVEGPGGTWLAAEDYYQGLSCTAVIRRKADGRLFGYPYWDDISKHGTKQIDTNGEENGFPYEERCDLPDGLNEVYVWLPAEPFTITGYGISVPAAAEVTA